MIRHISCIVLACDRCGIEAFFDNRDGDGALWHFDSVEDAADHGRQAGWFVAADAALCSTCVRDAECARLGHRFTEWQPLHRPGRYRGRFRLCLACGRTEHDPPLPTEPSQ